MKGYIFSIGLFFFSFQGIRSVGTSQKVNEVKKKGYIKKETPKVEYQYVYDSPHCDIGVVYDKNGKAIRYTYDSILTKRRSHKTGKF